MANWTQQEDDALVKAVNSLTHATLKEMQAAVVAAGVARSGSALTYRIKLLMRKGLISAEKLESENDRYPYTSDEDKFMINVLAVAAQQREQTSLKEIASALLTSNLSPKPRSVVSVRARLTTLLKHELKKGGTECVA